jgi:hypothetical protein
MKYVLALLFLSIVMSSHAQNNTADWAVLKRPGYSIGYPGTWRLDTTKKYGTDIFLFSPKVAADDTFSENVNVVIQDTAGLHLSPEEYIDLSLEQVKSMLKEVSLLENKRITQGNKSCYKVMVTAKQAAFNLKTTQYYFFVKDRVYIVTITLLQETYEAFKDTGERIIQSFSIK